LAAAAATHLPVAAALSRGAQLVSLDQRRQQNREALRALQGREGKAWVCMGPFFLKLPAAAAAASIAKGVCVCVRGGRALGGRRSPSHADQEVVEAATRETRSEVKAAVRQLQTLRPSEMDAGLVAFALSEAGDV
jgi:hypothetical protein